MMVGKSLFAGSTCNGILPSIESNAGRLYLQNRFAKNSMLFPRDVVGRYAMYDCYIAMRRLTEWDLWLRYIK